MDKFSFSSNPDKPNSELGSCTSIMPDSVGNLSPKNQPQSPTRSDFAHGLIQLAMSHTSSDDKNSKVNIKKQKDAKVSKVPGTEFVTKEMLDEAYRKARIRLQMCQSSLLFKFNDDDRRIFAELRAQLTETYNKLQESSSCVPAQQ